MSTPQKPQRPAFSRRGGGGGGRRPAPPEPQLGGTCRLCGASPALPEEDTCGPCGDMAIERARAGVDAWLGAQAEKVKEMKRRDQVVPADQPPR